MTKIALIGAGSIIFTRNLCSDILLSPALAAATLALMDIDPTRLQQAQQLVEALVQQRGLKARVEATTDRRAAVRDADYVITTFQQGGLEAFALDIEIPQRYGVEQNVGDTMGPGGIFRGLRTIPVLLDLCRDLDDVAPDALLLNYANPMAINCRGVARGAGRPFVGLCHSVQHTSRMLARWIDVPYDEVSFLCAGINHLAFFLTFRRGDEDLYPRLWRAIARPEVVGREPVRVELMQRFGYFVTESSGHASEYLPYFRKSAAQVTNDLVPRFKGEYPGAFDHGRTGGYLRWCQERAREAPQEFAALAAGDAPLPTERSDEYGAAIIEAMETNQPVTINGNLTNNGWIANLLAQACVEAPCVVDGRGIQPQAVGELPPQLAALMTTNINAQELAVEAALTGSRDALYHAVMLDPLTAAACTLDQIRRMVDDMLAADARWLPQFS